jgi:hypothetical protein
MADEKNISSPTILGMFPNDKSKRKMEKKLLVCNEQLPNEMGKDSVYMRESINSFQIVV